MRYEQPTNWGEQGLGLGLSICQRISHILDHPLRVRSRTGPRQHVLDLRAAARAGRWWRCRSRVADCPTR